MNFTLVGEDVFRLQFVVMLTREPYKDTLNRIGCVVNILIEINRQSQMAGSVKLKKVCSNIKSRLHSPSTRPFPVPISVRYPFLVRRGVSYYILVNKVD